MASKRDAGIGGKVSQQEQAVGRVESSVSFERPAETRYRERFSESSSTF